MRTLISLMAVAILTGCNALPSSGPGRSAIQNSGGELAGDMFIVEVNSSVARAAKRANGYGFPSSFFNVGRSSNYEIISAGDVLQITVWENVDNGVFATLGQRVTPLAEMRVTEAGTIFVPFVGQIRATGRTSEQLRREITSKLEDQTPEPQIEVRRVAGQKGSARVFSSGGGGLIPFNEGNQTLSSMLASAGGAPGDPRSTRVTLTRGSKSGTILLQDLFDNPKNDVTLQSNDRINIENDRRFFRMLGAGGAQALIPFARAEVSVLDAIAEVGGLSAATADPTGVFVFRKVDGATMERLSNGSIYAPRRVAFTFNLKDPQGMFVADEFKLADGDTIYVTEAPFITWTKVIGAISSGASSIESLNSVRSSIIN